MFTLLDLSVSLDDDGNRVVLVTLGADASPENVAELTKTLGKEFELTPK
jgi:hypothetical protein